MQAHVRRHPIEPVPVVGGVGGVRGVRGVGGVRGVRGVRGVNVLVRTAMYSSIIHTYIHAYNGPEGPDGSMNRGERHLR